MPKTTTYEHLQAGNTVQNIQRKGGMGIARVALAFLALGGVFGVIEGATAKTAKAAVADSVAHHIINGPWYLHPGNPTDTPSISSPTSDLMPTGTEFDVQCVTTGNAITPDGNLTTNGNGDTAWEYGTDAATGDIGFVSDQGLDTQVTQGQEIAQLAAQGIPECGSQGSDSTQQTTQSSSSGVTTVFFSPNTTPTALPDLIYDTTFNTSSLLAIPSDEWMPPDYCSDANVSQYVPSTANTLVGWSESRLAPVYFLAANRNRWSQIHTIVLFDPGDTNDFTGTSCDTGYGINALLAEWLQSAPQGQNKLFVFAGERSETNGFHGLWSTYFADIWHQSQTLGQQTFVCDYHGMGHPDVLQNFADYVGELSSMTTCPPSPDDVQYPLTSWHP